MTSATELHAALVGFGFPERSVYLPDPQYSLPHTDYMTGLGGRYVRFLKSADLGYAESRFDCDDYCRQLVSHAHLEHAMLSRTKETAFGVGWCYGFNDNGGHALIIAAHRDEYGKLWLQLYEPQPINDVCLEPVPNDYFDTLFFCHF